MTTKNQREAQNVQEMAFEQLENALVKDQTHPHSVSGASSVTSIGKPRGTRTDSARNDDTTSSPTFRDASPGQGMGLFDDDKDQYPDPINSRSSTRSKLSAAGI